MDVTIHPLPKPDFMYQSVEKVFFQSENSYRLTDSIFKDKQVDFTNLTFGHPDTAVIDKNVSFYWDFIGDGIFTEHAFNTSYEYDESGQFMVQLLAVDEMWGCKDTVAKPLTVVVNPNCGLTYPNAFTPDLDDNNNFYPIYNEGVLENGYELRIYNRWGALLWSTQDLYGKWDGVYKGEIAKQDVYVYHVKAVCEEKDPATGEHRVLNIKGDVTVIR
jgi:gliding motility-associated-like protein